MILAVMGDCNGDAAALARTLDAIADEGIMSVFCTGNIAGPSGADEVRALLEAQGVPCAQGERDRLLLRFEQKAQTLKSKLPPEEFDLLSRTHSALSSSTLEYLRGLHKRVERSIDGVKVLVCHGSPVSQGEIIDDTTPHARLQRLRESVEAQIILCGGSSQPWHRWVDGVLFAGPGPLPTHGFTVVDTESEPWRVRVAAQT